MGARMVLVVEDDDGVRASIARLYTLRVSHPPNSRPRRKR